MSITCTKPNKNKNHIHAHDMIQNINRLYYLFLPLQSIFMVKSNFHYSIISGMRKKKQFSVLNNQNAIQCNAFANDNMIWVVANIVQFIAIAFTSSIGGNFLFVECARHCILSALPPIHKHNDTHTHTSKLIFINFVFRAYCAIILMMFSENGAGKNSLVRIYLVYTLP